MNNHRTIPPLKPDAYGNTIPPLNSQDVVLLKNMVNNRDSYVKCNKGILQRQHQIPGLSESKNSDETDDEGSIFTDIDDNILKSKNIMKWVDFSFEYKGEIIQHRMRIQVKSPGTKTLISRITDDIERHLEGMGKWDIWEWAKKVPGIGVNTVAALIILFYYRFIPICKTCGGDLKRKNEEGMEAVEEIDLDDDEFEGRPGKKGALICSKCGKAAKNEGLLTYRQELKDFPNVSKWHAYLGLHTVKCCPKCSTYKKPIQQAENEVCCSVCKTPWTEITTRMKPKRAKGIKNNWSTKGRTVAYTIGHQLSLEANKHSPYYAVFQDRIKKKTKKRPEWPDNHIKNAAKNEVGKIFLSHWWCVARSIAGLPVSKPYAMTVLGHTNYIEPFYWDKKIVYTHESGPNMIQPNRETNETHPPIVAKPRKKRAAQKEVSNGR